MSSLSTKKIVVIGGGTGTFTVLSGLRNFPSLDLTAIVAMSDDGGSTGKLRDELGVLPPGDARQCLVALAESPEILRQLFTYRFNSGDLRGHNFGNLFLSALEKITGSFEEALDTASKVLSIKGSVLPVTQTNVNLQLNLTNGDVINGEDTIGSFPIADFEVSSLTLFPTPIANPRALRAILEADMVVIGPGKFYCSLLPSLIVPGIKEALKETSARVLYNVNLMSRREHCNDWSVETYLDTLTKYLEPNTLDIALYNTSKPSEDLLLKYQSEGTFVTRTQPNSHYNNVKLIGADLLSPTIFTNSEFDPLERTLIRHDSYKLARAIYSLL
jgi:uncharacterized cofD-like protein